MNKQWSETIDRYIREGRTVSGGTKGKEKKLSEDQLNKQNAQQNKAFSDQQSTLKSIKDSLGGYLSGNTGFDPQQLALLKSQFLGQNAQDFNSARSNVMSALASRGSGGGQGPVGGDFTKGLSGLYGAEASSKASGLTGINLQNLSQALTNKFNAANIFSGNAATLNSPISTFGSGATNALDERVKIGLTPGFGSSFMTSFGGALGAGLGGGLTGGIGTAASHVGSGNYGF